MTDLAAERGYSRDLTDVDTRHADEYVREQPTILPEDTRRELDRRAKTV